SQIAVAPQVDLQDLNRTAPKAIVIQLQSVSKRLHESFLIFNFEF
ncbi:MAG: hypothetical protein HW373_1635, partial [Deltaproteobacteria bacterium]|nr:hypothetical protein [Deltaproteobacteria bacterium]